MALLTRLQELEYYVHQVYAAGKRKPRTLLRRSERVLAEPLLTNFTHEEVADLVAIEQGFTSWGHLVEWHLNGPRANRDQWLMHQVMSGSVGVPESSTGLAYELVEASHFDLSATLSEASINQPIEPLQVPPLVYACCSAIGSSDATVRVRRRELVTRLLSLGADPNAGLKESFSIRGYLTCLGGAVGRARDPEIVRLLLDSGADSEDGPTLYEGGAVWEAVRHQDMACLKLLLEAEPPEWIVCHALTHSLQFLNLELTLSLLDAGADPNWDKTVYGMGGNALHEAIQCDCPPAFIQALVRHEARLDMTDEGGRTPIAIATALGRADLVQELIDQSADPTTVKPIEAWIGGCYSPDQNSSVASDLNAFTDYEPSYHDNLWVNDAVRRGEVDACRALLAQLDPNVIDYEGETPLHRTVQNGNHELVQLLLEAGAKVNSTNFEGDTVVETACRDTSFTGLRTLDLLADFAEADSFNELGHRLKPEDQHAFESAVDLMLDGDLNALTEIVEQYPYFNRARSVRPHRCTLMNYIGANGFEGERQRLPDNVVEVIDWLIAKGCDPNALCYTYRGGPGETTIGLFSSSGVVPSKQVSVEMIRAMVRGGAKTEPGIAIVFQLLDAKENGMLEEVLQSLDAESQEVRTAWIELCGLKEFDIVEQMLRFGMDINNTNHLNQTVLHFAALNGDKALVDWLLEHDARLDIVEDQFGGTAIGWAHAGGHPSLAEYLANSSSD